ncbi:diguanylate cyclase [methanotrophic endosymbiont of Bathymodiolus puteoserpentis (Logatchev)]|uniref:diguanylate cyclase n=1 Tax=methanotrophic endosymbiont of Bathymodiolus puteoserpentis (Logatchev) TaxID=343235 RepID=UPI00157A718C
MGDVCLGGENRRLHITGDQALQSIANTLREMVRDGDILARWGGEEFTILLPETDLIQALILAERLRETIAKLSIVADETEINFTVSIGVAQKETEMSSIESLFNQADIFMYQAKQAGRNQVYGIYLA